MWRREIVRPRTPLWAGKRGTGRTADEETAVESVLGRSDMRSKRKCHVNYRYQLASLWLDKVTAFMSSSCHYPPTGPELPAVR